MSLFAKAAELEAKNKKFAFVSITSSKGSVPRERGHMILLPDGRIIGTIGGGPAEQLVIQEGLKCLEKGLSRSLSYRLDSGSSPDSINMVCGGNMEFFIEVFMPLPSLFLAGAGHVSRAVARQAELLGYPYVVADSRPGFPSEKDFPGASERLHGDSPALYIAEAVERGLAGEETALVIATHNHDDAALDAALQSPCFYIGMLGSRGKTALFMKKMREAGYPREVLDKVHAPIGLDIGSETPEEIAVSILAEIMMIRSGNSGRPLRLKMKPSQRQKPLVLVRGAGDLATGVIVKLHKSGFAVAALESKEPTVIRRHVSLAGAVQEGQTGVEGVQALCCREEEQIREALAKGLVPVIPDPEGQWINRLKPCCLVDAILAKKNLGTRKDMASVVIALGPGFTAGEDADAVVETCRGHALGKVILKGKALENTGIPGNIAGYTHERVIFSPCAGKVDIVKDIGSLVQKGDVIARVGTQDIPSPLDGVVRGMIASGTQVPRGFKMADVDPRGEPSYCYEISDKARAVAGGVLEALLALSKEIVP